MLPTDFDPENVLHACHVYRGGDSDSHGGSGSHFEIPCLPEASCPASFVAPRPEALGHWSRAHKLDRRAINIVVERWRAEDVPWCPYPTEANPAQPGVSVMLRLVSWATLKSSSPLSVTAAARLLRDLGGDGKARPPLLCYGGDAGAPEPLERWERYFVVNELPVKFIGERWRDEDARWCRHETEACPAIPGTRFAMWLVSLVSGRSSRRLTDYEVKALLDDPRSRCDYRG